MDEQIRQLIKLQDIDLELDALKEECEFIPVEIENYHEKISEMKNKLDEDRKKLKEFQIKHKELELELSSKEDVIKKHKIELNAIKTNEQYRALLNEISKAEQEKSHVEDEVLKLMEEIDLYNNSLKENTKIVELEEKKTLDVIKLLEDKKQEIEKNILLQEEERKKIADTVSGKNILKKYEYIRKSKDGLAIVPIENNICGSCHIILPPQVLNEVMEFNELVVCDNCSRILYLPEKGIGKDKGSPKGN